MSARPGSLSFLAPYKKSLSVVLLLAACSAKTDLSITTNPQWAQIQAHAAVAELINDKTPSDIKASLEKVRTLKQESDFDWPAFWNELSTATLSGIDDATNTELLSLHQLRCDTESFRAFAHYVLSTHKNLRYLAGDVRRCDVALGPELTASILKALMANPQLAQPALDNVALSRFLVLEFKRDTSHTWQSVLSDISLPQWQQFATDIFNARDSDTLKSLTQLYQSVFGDAALLSPLMQGVLTDPAQLNEALTSLGFDFTSQMLENHTHTKAFQVLSAAQIQNSLQQLTSNWKASAPALSNPDRAAILWQQYLRLQLIQNDVDPQNLQNTGELLAWHEDLSRFLESELRRSPLSVRAFLATLPTSSLNTAWFRLRLLGRKDSLTQESAQAVMASDLEQPGDSRGMQVLRARLRAHFESGGPEAQRQSLIKYCALLGSLGLPRKIILASQLKDWLLGPNLAAGCHVVQFDPGAEDVNVVIEAQKIQSPFDMVLSLPRNSLELRAPLVDLAFLDLSTAKVRETLPNPPADPRKNAVAFPVLIGLKVADVPPQWSKGVHFFLMHFNYRAAVNGDAPAFIPQQGFSGNTLALSATDATLSFAPTTFSLGGPGQQPAAAAPGGESSVSTVSMNRVEDWRVQVMANYVATNTDPTDPLGEKPFLERHLKVVEVRSLIQNAERDASGKIKLYVPVTYTSILDANQLAKVQTLLQELSNGGPQLSLEDFLKGYVGPLAFKQLEDQILARYTPGTADQETPLELQMNQSFTVPAAAPGPVAPAGAQGAAGALSISGFKDF